MRLKRCAVATCFFVALVNLGSPVAQLPVAQGQALDSLVEEPDDARRLDGWLKYHMRRERRKRLFSGWSVVHIGLAAVGFGLWLMLDPFFYEEGFTNATPSGITSGTERSSGPFGVGATLATLGAFAAVRSIFDIVRKSSAEERYERWQKVQRRGISETDIARFEGGFELEARLEKRRRRRAWVSSFALMAGGLATLITSAAGRWFTDANRVGGYLTGGLLVGSGALMAGTNFGPSTMEGDLRDYRRGFRPVDGETRSEIERVEQDGTSKRGMGAP